VLPGYRFGDRSTVVLRRRLAVLGHPVHGWRLGRNEGPSPQLMTSLGKRFDEVAARYEHPISMVGWSLGGVYAWHLAWRSPEQVDQVITLGSPLRSTTRLDGVDVASTSIWSRADRVVPWRESMLDPGEQRENIEVRATHAMLGFDPFVSLAIADRLGQDERWTPFDPPWWLSGAYPHPGRSRR
jgi:pimeloyl-ACP methyl ester carboxylesterase